MQGPAAPAGHPVTETELARSTETRLTGCVGCYSGFVMTADSERNARVWTTASTCTYMQSARLHAHVQSTFALLSSYVGLASLLCDFSV